MPLVILHHLLNVSVYLANKRGLNKINKFINYATMKQQDKLPSLINQLKSNETEINVSLKQTNPAITISEQPN
jgi:hypothetical protein